MPDKAEQAQPVLAVVGANGFIGRSLTRVAHDRGWRTIRIVRGPASTDRNLRFTPDLEQERDLAALLDGADACVNLAARVHVMKPGSRAEEMAAHAEMNARFPVRLAEAAASAGVQRFVQLSSVAAITSSTPPGVVADDETKPSPNSPYGIAKLDADRALEGRNSSTFTTVSLRPPAVFGPSVGAQFARLMAVAQRGIPLPVGGIENRRSFAFVDNISTAILAAAEGSATGAYIVTDSPPLSTAALYRQLQALYGRRPTAPALPAMVLKPMAALLLGERATSLIGDAAFDGSRFATTFGWKPEIEFSEALRVTVAAAEAEG